MRLPCDKCAGTPVVNTLPGNKQLSLQTAGRKKSQRIGMHFGKCGKGYAAPRRLCYSALVLLVPLGQRRRAARPPLLPAHRRRRVGGGRRQQRSAAPGTQHRIVSQVDAQLWRVGGAASRRLDEWRQAAPWFQQQEPRWGTGRRPAALRQLRHPAQAPTTQAGPAGSSGTQLQPAHTS